MAFDVQEIQTQVQLMVGHDGLSGKVLTWTNRVVQALATKAYWQNQVKHSYVPFVTAQTNVSSNWITAGLTNLDVINPFQAVQVQMSNATQVSTYLNQLVHRDPEGLYANYQGRAVSTTGTVDEYTVVGWASITETATTINYVYPKLAIFPNASNTTTTNGGGEILLKHLQAPTKFTASSDTNWFVQKYFSVVLAGVMRLARLYIGDIQGYLLEKSEFENGIRDMVMNEETASASTPVLQSITPEAMQRFRG